MSSVNFDNMTKDEKQAFESKRSRYFKSTIAISTIYGVFALGMFLIATVSERGKTLLGEELLPFTVTLLGGMIVVIIFLVVSVMQMKPINTDTYAYDRYACPDYWSLQRLTKAQLNRYDSADRFRMQYRCRPSKNIFGDVASTNLSYAPVAPATTLTDTELKLIDVLKVPTNSTPVKNADNKVVSGFINCGEVFPEYMAFHDQKNDPQEPNKLRCAYAKKCGIPWSSACPK